MKEIETIRLKCPDANLSNKERISDLLVQLENWINSPHLEKLLSEFKLEIPDEISFTDKVKLINDFVNDNWDFRKNKGERWNVTEDNLSVKQKELINNAAKELGLYDISEPVENFNYVLPLGGARMSNFDRPVLGKEVILENNPEECTVVGLSGKRLISDIEKPYLAEYAPGVKTEYDALTEGIIKVFEIKNNNYHSEFENNNNQNLSWEIRSYIDKFKNYPVFSLAAPSSDPSRRANSRDTFDFFLEKFNIENEDKVLLITSCIYVPYQLLAFIDLALDKGFYVDCIGTPPQRFLSNYTNYLQEIKGTVNQINRLVDKYYSYS